MAFGLKKDFVARSCDCRFESGFHHPIFLIMPYKKSPLRR